MARPGIVHGPVKENRTAAVIPSTEVHGFAGALQGRCRIRSTGCERGRERYDDT